MDEKTKNRIREFVALVIGVQEPGYPSCDGEQRALIDAVASEMKLPRHEVLDDTLGAIWDLKIT